MDGDARDAHAVVLDLPRLVLVAVEDAGDDLDLVVLRERLAELGQEVRGRLDAGPVVLVEDEDSLALPPVTRSRLAADRATASRTVSRKPSTLGP